GFGIAATTLCLMDYVVCSESAFFSTPFSYIGVGPEGTSSVSFERVMGTSKANEMILFGEPLSSADALRSGFVSKVFPKNEFRKCAEELVSKLQATLPKTSVLASKELIKGEKFRNRMLIAHEDECRLLKKLFLDQRTIELIRQKFARSKI
ncbi:hypothetical protein PFISCL1PPCAC_16716, partial [Pristionchus fissidentatus]